jgi:AraC-like DNA-binding protein
MRYGEWLPAEALRAYVSAYWQFSVHPHVAGPIEHTIPPDGSVSLSFNVALRRLMILGPRTMPNVVTVRGGDAFCGARLWPGACTAFIPSPLAALRNRTMPAEELGLGEWIAPLACALAVAKTEAEIGAAWNHALGARLAWRADAGRDGDSDVDVDPAVDAAARAAAAAGARVDAEVLAAAMLVIRAHGELTVSSLACAVGLSPRHLRRRFMASAGLTPKELIRARRVRASVVGAVSDDALPWTDIAAGAGFSDQAHLTREVRRLLGLAPTALRAHLRRITHRAIVDP